MLKLQKALTAPKNKSAGRYNYRSVEDLYEKIKEIADAPLMVSTEAVELAGRILIKATAKYKEFSSTAFCEVESNPKNMSLGQAYGASTSYATKYAVCMLFCVDNGEDLDKIPVKVEKDLKSQLFSLLTQAGESRENAKLFYDSYCPNYKMLEHVVSNFEKFHSLWKKEGRQADPQKNI